MLPSDIPGLWVWYQADAITGKSDNDPVTQWDDSSGAARHATGGSPLYKTAVLNSLPVLRFDGVDDVLSLPDMSAFTAGTLFVVVKANADPAAATTTSGLWSMGGGAGGNTHYPYTNGDVYEGAGANTRYGLGNPAPSLAEWRIWCIHSGTNDWKAFLDTVQIWSEGSNTVAFGPWLSASLLGRSLTSTDFFLGDMAEFIAFDSVLSTQDRGRMDVYLSNKYGLALIPPTLRVLQTYTR